jgi:hypothetical protein
MIFKLEHDTVEVCRSAIRPKILLRINDIDERQATACLTPDQAEAVGRELCDLAGASRGAWLCSLGLLVLGLVTGVVVGWAVWG